MKIDDAGNLARHLQLLQPKAPPEVKSALDQATV